MEKCYTDKLLKGEISPEKVLAHYRQICGLISAGQARRLYEVLRVIEKLRPDLASQLPPAPAPDVPRAKTRRRQIFEKLKEYQFAAACQIADALEHSSCYTLADEVGMGKTYVALEVIGQLYQSLKPEGRPFNVYYLCHNQRILDANSKKLVRELSGHYTAQIANCDRLSMAYVRLAGVEIALYPMSSSLLQDTHSKEGNDLLEVEPMRNCLTFHRDLFLQAVPESGGASYVWPRAAQNTLEWKKSCGAGWQSCFQAWRNAFQKFTLRLNPPDLILLDEFHRMQPDDLAYLKALLQEAPRCRLLYISATPFRMERTELQSPAESGRQDDYGDGAAKETDFSLSLGEFLRLTGAPRQAQIASTHREYFAALQKLEEQGDLAAWNEVRQKAALFQQELRRVLCRNERGRLSDLARPEELENPHLDQWLACDLAAYARDFAPDVHPLQQLVPGFGSYQLLYFNSKSSKQGENRYQMGSGQGRYRADFLWEGAPGGPLRLTDWRHNPYLSVLYEAAVRDAQQLLWMPPIRPDYQPPQDHVFGRAAKNHFSKLLVFGRYQCIPRAVSSIMSRVVGDANDRLAHSPLSAALLAEWGAHQDFEEVKDLAARVPRQAMRADTLDSLVQALADKGLTESEACRALGDPAVCLYRLLLPGLQPFVDDFIAWAKQDGNLLCPASQSRPVWNAFFTRPEAWAPTTRSSTAWAVPSWPTSSICAGTTV